MTYLFKLVRRLAMLWNPAALAVLAMVVACNGESTAPDGTSVEGIPGTPAANGISLKISPRSVTIETGQPVQFQGQSASSEGRRPATHLEWRASGGTMKPDGSFISDRPGTYTVFGRGHGWKQTDTAVVRVVPPQPGVKRIRIAAHPDSIEVGSSYAFKATAHLKNGSRVKLGLAWTATGGTVDPSGVYTADSAGGTYHVIAANTAGTVADTTSVTVVAQGGSPVTPPSVPSLNRVIIAPASVTLTSGGLQKFKAYGRTTNGDSVAVGVTFKATGGSITPAGLYTAGQQTGPFRVIASANGHADTAAVSLTPGQTPAPAPTPTPAPPPTHIGRMGVPIGVSGLLAAGVSPGAYTMSLDGYTAGSILSRLSEARSKRMQVIMNMTGGAHDNYKTNGVFDMAKWKARMNTYNTPAIKAAVAAGVADGTIIGNSVMDEPMVTSAFASVSDAKSWGPAGTMTKARVDEMCGYVKSMFPTLPVGVVHDYDDFEPTKSYRTCGFIVSQYRWGKTRGDVKRFRDEGLAYARRDGIEIAFSLNVLHGGLPSTSCPKYGDDSPNGTLCPMSADQIREYGTVLGLAGCALNMWRYQQEYYSRQDIQTAVKAVAQSLAQVPRRACSRT